MKSIMLALIVAFSIDIQAQHNQKIDVHDSLFSPIFLGDLRKWDFSGSGTVDSISSTAFQMTETLASKGVMLCSKEDFPRRYILRFRMTPLTLSSVTAFLVHLRNDSLNSYSKPTSYDGSFPALQKKMFYFIALHNAAHLSTPFISRFSIGRNEVLNQMKDTSLPLKSYYDVEIGSQNDLMWISVDQSIVLEAKVDSEVNAGKFAFRLRGVPGMPAGCIYSNLRIYSLQ